MFKVRTVQEKAARLKGPFTLGGQHCRAFHRVLIFYQVATENFICMGACLPFKLGCPSEPFRGDSPPPPLQSSKRLIHLLCCLCMSMCPDGLRMCIQVLVEARTHLEMELAVARWPEWVLGAEVGCSARAASIRTTKPALQSLATLFEFLLEMQPYYFLLRKTYLTSPSPNTHCRQTLVYRAGQRTSQTYLASPLSTSQQSSF